jgi:hypothetical protein
MTADQVYARGINPQDVIVISYDWPPATDELVARGAQLAVLTSLEPPVIAWELYYHLPRLSARFPHVYLFGGGASRAAPATQFHPLYFPQVRQALRSTWPDWHKRKWLVSITSNKAIVRSFMRWFDRPREVSVKRELASLRYPAIARDLYLERLRAVKHFAGRADFDMFGQGWQRRHPAIPGDLYASVLSAYRGPVHEKLATMAQYRFALCFENSEFGGYVSEKIFDCFFTGTIPVYLGAPDVARSIPESAFIDMRRFRTYRDLEVFLDSLDEQQIAHYVESAVQFLHSDAYTPFKAECFAQQIVGMLTEA